MTEPPSLVAALRERADAGVPAVEIARWLRGRLGRRDSFGRFIGLLHHAFDLPRDRLRPLEEWTGWEPGGRLTDADAEALLAPLRARPAGFDRFALSGRERLPLPWVFERPFVVLGYSTSHSHLVLRSRVGEDLLDLMPIGVDAMRLRSRYERLEITAATGADRREMELIADIPEPYDADQHYLRLSDGVRDDFVVCGTVHVLHNGEPYALPETTRMAYTPRGAADPGDVRSPRFTTGFGVWVWTTDEHDLVLRSRKGGTDLVFGAVRDLQVRRSFGELTVAGDAGPDGLRRYTLTDGRHEGYVVGAGLRIHRD